MTVHELKPDNQYGYFDHRDEYDEWYERNLHLHPSQIRMDGHTYDDETNEVVFKVRPTNEEVRAVAFDAPPWVAGTTKSEPTEDTEDSEEQSDTTEEQSKDEENEGAPPVEKVEKPAPKAKK